MGQAGKVLHRKKLFDGKMSAEEFHSKYAFPPEAKCSACGMRPMSRAIVMMEVAEAKKNPLVEQLMLVDPAIFLEHVVQITVDHGRSTKPYLRTGIAYACKSHRKALEKQMAKTPSHCIVEFNHGPGTDRIIG